MKKERETINKGHEEMRTTISVLKNTEGIKSRLDEAEDQIRELEDKVEKAPERVKKGKEAQNNEEGLREMQDKMKCNNICIIGIPEGEEEEQEIENLFEKVMMENFPNLRSENSHKSRKHRESQAGGTQRGPLQDTS